MMAHSGPPVWPPWLALVAAEASAGHGPRRRRVGADWYRRTGVGANCVELAAVARPEPPELRIERERAVPEP